MNKEKLKEYYKKYAEKNKEKLKEYHKKYYQENKNDYIKRDKEQNKTEKRKLWKRKYKREYKQKNKNNLNFIAYAKIRHLLAVGKISRRGCQLCGELKTHYHHINYNLPYLVYELCEKHHKQAHKNDEIIKNIFPFDFSNLMKEKKGKTNL